MNDSDTKLLIVILLTAVLACAVWFFWDDIRPATSDVVIAEPEPSAEEGPTPKEPLHPITPSISEGTDAAELVPLPALDESNGCVRD